MAVRTEAYSASVARGRHSIIVWAFAWLLGVGALIVVGVTFLLTYFALRFPFGTRVGYVSLGGLTYEEARIALEKAYPRPFGPPLEVQADGRVWFLYPEEAGWKPQLEEALEATYQATHEGFWPWQLVTLWRTAVQGWDLDLSWQWDAGRTRLWLNRLVNALYRPWSPPTLLYTAQEPMYMPGRAGQTVDEKSVWAALQRTFNETKTGQAFPRLLTLSTREVTPPPFDGRALESTLRHRLTTPLRLQMGDQAVAIDPAELRTFVRWIPTVGPNNEPRVETQVDKEALRAYLERLNNRLRRPPVNARLDYDPEQDTFIVLSPSANGWEMDVDAAVDVVAQALAEGRTDVEIPVKVIYPQVPADATPQALGIREVIGESTTFFRGSSPARVANIVRAVEALRGVVIPPGEVFSFNAAVGAITAANGYEDSLIIWGDRTAVGIGGGVCQVSTTLFRAAFFAGLPIVERWNHGYIVSWYGEPGLDATVYSPYVDLKFKNTTDRYILIQPVVDTARGVLTFRLWGTAPGWEVEVSDPIQENVQEPPPPVYQEDPTLPPGTIRQVEWPKPGMTVRITRTVRKGDTVIERREFVSTYQPWRAVYLYGPGTIVPESH